MARKKTDTELTPKQQMVLDFVNAQVQEKGYPPSVREICAAVGFKSTSSAHAYLSKLEDMGLIIKDPSKPRALKVLNKSASKAKDSRVGSNGKLIDFPTPVPDDVISVPVVGKVTAGQPILAVENIEDTFPVPAHFVGNKETFMLRVKGDSMIEAGIIDGDFVLVSKQNTANNGDIIVALINDEATVKTFYKEKNHVRLQPENKFYDPIIVRDDFSILGKVIGVFRKL